MRADIARLDNATPYGKGGHRVPVPEIIAIAVLGFWAGVANPNLGEEEAVGDRGWYRSKERW